MKKNLNFKPRARLLLQLGDELIRNESIALLELVKNAYDADAKKVTLSMQKVDDVREGTIVVQDDGTGMDIQTLTESWMEPGSDYKKDTARRVTKKFKRNVLGEKGIGRFAAHKLGDVIELTTRKKGNKEIFVKIDWTAFQRRRYLDQVPVQIEERTPIVFKKNKSGTRIVIKKIRSPWTQLMMREVYRSYNSLESPFEAPESFKVKFETDKKDWLKDLVTWKQVKDYALFKFKCIIQGDQITKFEYEFLPWPSMDKLRPRKVTEKSDFGKILKMTYQKKPVDLSKYKIGEIHFEGLIFDRDSTIMKLGLQDVSGFKKYLDLNGGVKVFRDGVRIYDYGEPGNDWLELDLRRVNVPTVRISNNILIAAASLDRTTSSELIEKTNREGFIENEAYDEFKNAILYTLGMVEKLRKPDKDKIRNIYGPTPRSEPVMAQIDEVKKIIETKIKNKPIKDELIDYMDKIESDYKQIHDTLLRGAGAGLNLSVAVHEVEKIVDELKHVVKSTKISRRVTSLVKHLSELVEGYVLTIQKSSMQKWDPEKLIDHALFNFEFRFKAHQIKIVRYKSGKKQHFVKCARGHIVGAIMNILDNSIFWLDYSGTKDKKIFISVYEDKPGTLAIVIADNGTGFALPTDEITEPFVSAKPDGMGLGLHIASEIMTIHHGKITFPQWADYDIPEDFKRGAIVALKFKSEQSK